MIITVLLFYERRNNLLDHINLLDMSMSMCKAWDMEFSGNYKRISIVNADFESFITENDQIDGIVSPANSFGLMDIFQKFLIHCPVDNLISDPVLH